MSAMDTTLTDLAQLLRREGLLDAKTNLHDAGHTGVTGADCDSRVAAPGHVFVCKGAAFRASYLRDALGINRDQVVVFGDAGNDVPMFTHVDWSVAVAGATDEASAAARFHIGRCEDDAVAVAIEALVAGEWPFT